MKHFAVRLVAAAALSALAVAAQPFWMDAPDCVQSCVSSAWASSAWATATAFCDDSVPVASCFSSSCTSPTLSAVSNFMSMSSSMCSRYSSCVSAGSTAAVTVTATGVEWDPYAWSSSSNWPFHGATTTFTVPGCPWVTDWPGMGGGWGGGWGGSSWGSGGVWSPGGGFWGSSQTGWAYRTMMTTVTATVTSAGSVVTTTGVATIEEAVSGSVTSTTTFFGEALAASTSTATPSKAGASLARPLTLGGSTPDGSVNAAVKITAVALTTVMIIVGML